MLGNKKSVDGRRLLAKLLIAGSVFLCLSGNAVAALQITKTIDPFSPSPAAENDSVRYNLTVTNTGPGNLNQVIITDTPSNLSAVTYTPTSPIPGPDNPGPGINQYRINNFAAGQVVTFDVDATVNAADTCPVIDNSVSVTENSGTFTDSDAAPSIEYDFEFTSGTTSNVISHLNTSYCEFCDTGLVTIRITNPTTTPLTNIVLQEDLQSLGLTYINNSTTVSSGSAGNPTITGGGTVLTWDGGDLSALNSLAPGATLDVSFQVSTFDEAQMLADQDRDIIASVTFETACTTGPHTADSGQFELPIRQPRPQVFKQGRNYDANQNDWQETVYGNFNDDIIWRVLVRNLGDANMEALRINDSITGNFSINYICPTLGDANDVGLNNGVAPGGSPCISMASPFNVADPFGSAADPDDIGTGGSRDGFFYYVGRVLNNNTDATNTADVSWGCAAESPSGGLIVTPASVNGSTPAFDIDDTADLETTVTTNGLQVTQTVTGINTSQDLGTRGIVTITLNNQTGGSIQNLEVTASLPAGYVVDNTYGPGAGLSPGDANYGQPTSTQTGAYGNYPGFIDTVTRDDAALLTVNPLDDLNPHFTLTSTVPVPPGNGSGDDPAQQDDMMREDDVITIRFGIIMTDPLGSRFDLVADLDLAPEVSPGTDPASALTLSNTVTVDFDAVNPTGPQNQQRSVDFNNIDANPEDLDVDISDALFILTNDPGNPLDLNVILTNNGGHDADNYTLYITLGVTMFVQDVAPGCALTSNPPPHPVWNDPAFIPGDASVYACNRGTIAPGVGNEETFTFTVIKNAAGLAEDDLTFRADVVGEIHYADSTPAIPNPLLDPAPASIANTTPNLQLVNNYTLDGIRSRVLGFNLVQSAWYCYEDGQPYPGPPADILTPAVAPPNLPGLVGNLNSQIGEDCAYRVESGGWFGFLTPGFTLIEVRNVELVQDLPENLPSITDEGQGFILFGGSAYNFTSTTNITPAIDTNGGATTTPLDNNDITWQFNVTGSGITTKDEFFRVDFKTRLLNDPVDGLYPIPPGYAPNLHGNTSTGVTRTYFDAVFDSPTTGIVTIGVHPPEDLQGNPNVPGYPDINDRRVSLTDVEPNLIVTKTVCNETLAAAPNPLVQDCIANDLFTDSVSDGDTNDSYIYRITLTNETSAPVRSPAFNVIATDILDASDQMFIVDFETDGLDNNGDGSAANGDAGEIAMYNDISDNIVNNGTRPVITLDESHGAPFAQIDSGVSVTYYYRVDPDISIAPLQTLTNTVTMSYDSLDGAFGNQNPPQLDNDETAPNDVGRARIYTSIPQIADVTMIPVISFPKIVVEKANPVAGVAANDVSVGEEIRYVLVADIPVANLRQFTVRDELPFGVRCIEGQTVNLDAFPYDAAGFSPGGTFSGNCGTAVNGRDFVQWNFGDQAVTQGDAGQLFNFAVSFIARVENSSITNENDTFTNGGVPITDPSTCTSATGGGVGVCYVNDSSMGVSLDFASVDITVREPVIALTKSFLPVINSDAADVLTVTVVAENTGTTAAYNLQILDDLVGSDMTYINDSMTGANAPDDDGVAADSKLPIFSWDRATNADYEILPGVANVKTFTFQVRVDTTAQPLEILDNTIEAKWDSLPGQDVAINHLVVPQGIGPDGTLLGMRNGAVPNLGVPANAPNDYEITASASTSVLPLTMSKTDLSTLTVPPVVPTIGAHRNFEVVINLPEGTTENLVIDDALIFGGVSYVLSRDGALFDVTYTFEDIVSINGLAPDESVFSGATVIPSTLPINGDNGTITWDIGQVITDEEDDLDGVANTVNPKIIINYFARPNNDVATNVGVDLQNSATVNYDNGEDASPVSINATTAVQTVLEPDLAITKAVSNFTNAGVGPVGGDVLEYQISIINNGNSTAFDSNIVDTLPAELLFDPSFTPTATITGIGAVPGFVAIPSGATVGPLVWGRDNIENTPPDNSLDIPPGETLVLTYHTIVQTTIQPNVVLSNSALVDWTSLDDTDPSSAFERTGAGCPVILAPNDYCSAPAVANITANDTNSIVKTVIFDTYDEAPLSTAFDSIVRIGDTVTYQLDVNLQQGTTTSVNILDSVPGGMAFVDVVSINGATTAPYASPVSGPGSNFSYTPIPATDVPSTGDTGPIFNWALGTIANDAAGDATTDTLVIIYRARVVDNVAATIPQQPTTTLTNTADLTYIDGIGNPSPGGINDSADIFVRQPVMDALSKTDRLTRPSGITVNVATDIMEFRLHTCNTNGLARAYGLLMTDTLPMQMDEASITGPTNGALAPDVLINGVLATAGSDYVYTPPAARGGDMVFRFNTPIDPGECVDIDFNMGFYTDFGANQSWSNTVAVDEYYSLPPADAQLYSIVLPEVFNMNNLGTSFPPPEKTMVTPAPAVPEATVGDDVIYEIRVPETPANAIMYDVNITDTLNASLFYVGAVDIGLSNFTITDNTVPLSNNIDLMIDQIPAGQQAIIRISARVDNNLSANAGVSFVNSATYMFANAPAGVPILGGTDNTASVLNIIEPAVAVAKSVINTTKPGAPDAGDVLRYTVTLTASGGGVVPADFFSDAFDLSIDDTLSLGLLYIDGSETVTPGSTINLPVKVGDGIATPQSLSWSLAQANADIDVTEGDTVTVTYDVVVLDSVLADQNLSNTVDIQWSSRDGPDVNERDGSGVPPLNDYFNLVSAVTLQTTPDNNIITKSRLSDTYNPLDNIVRIGDIVEYQLVINMQEGTHTNFVIEDTLDEGLIFEGTVSINGQAVAPYPAVSPFSHAAIPAAIVSGDPATGPTTVTWTPGGDVLNPGDVINAGDNDITNDSFIIVYRARVLNLALLQLPTIQTLDNNVDFDYFMASGSALTKTSSQQLELHQPELSVTKTSLPADGSVINAGDDVTYTVEITNNGDSPAYDTELLDIIPLGLRSPTITMVSMSLASGAPLPAVPLAPVYDPVTGTANWNFDTGTADEYSIPALDTLQIVYQVQADAGLGAGLTLTNQAQVQLYYSFDNDAVPSLAGITGVREIYGPSNLADVDLTTTPANALLKINPADLDASIGETFTYRITVPETPQLTALYDVQILDDLLADSAADLRFDSVAWISGGTLPIVPVNIGTVPDNLIIADVTNGIDIPADDQVVIEITVTLRDSDPPNIAPLAFSNAASYTFNQINGDNTTVSAGLGNTTPVMTVVEPDLSLVKTGPAGTVNFLAPIPYTVVVSNTGTGPAFDTTIVDQLPDVPDPVIPALTGGTCDAAPINIVASIVAVPVRPLLVDIDYTATHTAAPTCELVITTLSDKARIEVGEQLIVTYETTLDVGTQSGAALTNIAGVTRWFSLDTAGAGATDEIREYTSIATSSATVIVEAPVLDVQKTVMNVTTTQDPGDNATPGDRLSYTIVVSNNGLVDANAVSISDAIPANATYIADTVTLNGLPVGQPDGGISPLVAGIDISSSDLPPPTPGNGTITVGETATITFDILLNPAITSGTVISNQAIVDSPSTGAILSDDPVAAGTANPTTTLITSAPAFIVQKTSLDITGDPAILLPGDTLRYTLRVKNIGLEDGINSLLADQIPTNTTYVANSTRLNAIVIADPAASISPLAAGMLINAPENTTAGYLRADTNVAANNVATITFDVTVNLSAVSGTVISNQGFFSGSGAGSGVFPQQPSDDPDTALVDDPTIDVVGNVPVINSVKTVAIENDVNGNGFVDPGDTLRYTITTANIGAMPATGVVLTDNLDDPVAAQITYVPGSGLLDGLPAGISFVDPVLTVTIGDLLPAASAVVIFDVTVDAGVLPGTIISNQGSVASNELPIELTDADGNPANGYQTTDIVVGNVQQLTISKQVTVVGGGAAEPGKQLEYVISVTNIGALPAQNVVITDILDPAVMTYVAGSGLLDGLVTGVSYDDTTIPASPTLTADYSTTYGDLPVAGVTEFRFRVLLDAALNIGNVVINTAEVSWNLASQTASASVSIDIGGTPGSVNINGQVWHDTDFDNVADAEEVLLQDYRVELYRNGLLLANTLTDVNGVYAFSGLPPNTIANPYEVRYLAPNATATTATLGNTNSAFTDGPQRITNIFAASGTNLQNLNLPRQVNGVVYDSVLRVPVAGVQLTMINQTQSNQLVPPECFDDGIQANQVTLADGYYKFALNFNDPKCAEGDEYVIQVQPPASGYIGTTSVIIPPIQPITGNALDVPNCPGNASTDKIPATAEHCENSASAGPAPVTVPPRDAQTDYNLKFLFADTAGLSTNQIYNNHIPVDSELGDIVAISKVAGKLNVTRSDLVPYTITFNNTLGVPLFDISIIDNFPAGFKYVTGSARVDGAEIEPQIDGRLLTWSGLNVGINESRVIKLLLIVGSGVGEGEYVNTAQAINTLTGDDISGVATATVRVIPDPTFDCTDIIGKVFDDKNLNTYQDDGERGIPGVQVATARGLRVTTDSHGRFHITCAIVPNEVRGSNFIMKLDDRTLPSGYRVTTENPRVQRATRGKMLKFNFGTAVHRVVRLDLADGVFEKGSTELRPQWRSRIDLLITELQKEGSILRLSYLAENETEDDVDDRLDAIEDLVSDRWQDLDCCYKLTIETEVFWRKGSPSAGREFAE